MYFPDGFNQPIARTCIQLTSCAYDMYTQWKTQGGKHKKGDFHWLPSPRLTDQFIFSLPIWSAWEWMGIINESEPFGFVALSKNEDGIGYLVYRGTESISDWAIDIDASQKVYDLVPNYGKVHHGFFELYKSMSNDTISVLSEMSGIKKLYVTGHSLGCGLSTLAVPNIVNQLTFDTITHCNFASPRVGDPIFTEKYNENNVVTFRIVNTCDLVPELPVAVMDKILYQHVGTPIDFTAQYGTVAKNHSLVTSYQYALEHPDNPGGIRKHN